MSPRAFARGSGPETTRDYLGHLFTFLADAAGTGGAFAMIDATVRKGLEPPPHTHTHEDETYVILEGRWTFRAGTETISAGPGSLVFLPRGVQHSFSVEEDAARALILLNPPGLEEAFWAMSEPTDVRSGLPPRPEGPPPIPRILAVFGANGIEFAAP